MDPGGDRWEVCIEDSATEMCYTSEGVSPARSVMPAAAQDLMMQALRRWRHADKLTLLSALTARRTIKWYTIQRYYRTKVLLTKVLFGQRYYNTKVLFGTKIQPILGKSQYLDALIRLIIISL